MAESNNSMDNGKEEIQEEIKEEKEEEEEEAVGLVPILLEFFGNTSAHGFQYLAIPHRQPLRKIIWVLIILSALGCFGYLTESNVRKLLGNLKSVSVDVNFNKTVPLPAVTICNLNVHKLTALFSNNLFDVAIDDNLFDLGSGQETSLKHNNCSDEYLFQGVQCGLKTAPDDNYHVTIVNVSRLNCRRMCTTLYSEFCSGFFYAGATSSCYIGPYIQHNPVPVLIPDRINCTKRNRYEFQRRLRCLDKSSMTCTFEGTGVDESCPIEYDEYFESGIVYGAWTILTADWRTENIKPSVDSTLSRRSGKYLVFKHNGQVGGSLLGLIRTDYFNSTDKCLSFYYNGDTPDNSKLNANLTIKVYNEAHQSNNLLTLGRTDLNTPADYPVGPEWYRSLIRLPSGINKLVIEAAAGVPGTVIMIDDFLTQSCGNILYGGCYNSPSGTDYLGRKNVSHSGKPCMNWSRFPFLASSNVVPAGSENFCRYPAISKSLLAGLDAPSCLVETELGYELDECDIPYCDCEQEEFKCTSGLCISRTLACDGNRDCEDGSDETRNCTIAAGVTEPLSLACKFLTDYKCGYYDSESIWQAYPGPAAIPTMPSTDSRYLYVAGNDLDIGQRILLNSPQFSINDSTPLHFTYYLQQSSLHLNYAKQEYGIFAEAYIQDAQSNGEVILDTRWKSGYVCLEADTMAVAFLAESRSERGEEAYVALGEIQLGEPGSCNVTNHTDAEPGISTNSPLVAVNCDFGEGNLCGYVQYSNYAYGEFAINRTSRTADAKFTRPFSNTPTIWINSPWVELGANTTFCLEIDAVIQDVFHVDLIRPELTDPTMEIMTLLTVETEESSLRNTFVAEIGSQTETFIGRIKLEMSALTGTSRLSQLSKIELIPLKCQDIRQRSRTISVTCDFSRDLCGYVAMTESPWPWMRKKRIVNYIDIPYLRVELGKDPTGHSFLISPNITNPTVEKCLTLDYNVTGPHRNTTLIFKLFQLWSNGSTTKVENFVPDPAETQTTATLPRGNYRLQFTSASLFPLHPHLDLEIHKIDVNNGRCSGSPVPEENSPVLADPIDDDNVTNGNLIEPLEQTKDEENSIGVDTKENIIDWLLLEYGVVSNYDVYWKSGPTKDNMLLRCQLEKKTCPESLITETLADHGRCVQFNTDPDNAGSTNLTGADNGLSLIFNVADYEKYFGNTISSGLKMLLHTPGDVAKVISLGSDVLVGTNTLAQVRYSRLINLPDPYTDCAEKPVPYYTEPYTIAKCTRSCAIERAAKNCQCKAYYMTRAQEHEYCSYQKYFSCIYQNDYTVGCECTEACDSVSHPAVTSSSRLAVRNISKLIDGPLQTTIRRDQTIALDLRDRLNPSEFDLLVSDLENLYRMQEMIYKHVEYTINILNATQTNVQYGMRLFKSKVLDFDLGSNNSYPIKNLSALVDANKLHIKPFTGYLYDILREIQGQLLIMQSLGEGVEETVRENIVNNFLILMALIINNNQKTEDLDVLPKNLLTADPDDRECDTLVNYMFEVGPQLEKDPGLVSTDDLQLNIQDFMDRNCYLSYSSLLDGIEKTYQRMESPDIFSEVVPDVQDANITTFLSEESALRKTLMNLIKDYSGGSIDKVHLHNQIKTIHDTFEEPDKLMEKLKEQVHSNDITVNAMLKNSGEIVEDIYISTLNQTYLMLKYFPDADYEVYVRDMKIWLGPKIPVDRSELDISYRYKRDQLWRVWPDEVKYTTFVNTYDAFDKLKTNVGLLTDDAKLALGNMDIYYNKLQNLRAQFKSTLVLLNDRLTAFNAKLDIDDNFIQKNLIKLDLYYGERRLEQIEQQPTYDYSDFFNDVGGSMGLLIGMSAITLCEFIDLIVYNFLRLFCARRRTSPA